MLKMLISAKLKGSWNYKLYFLKLDICLRTYQISSFYNSNEVYPAFTLRTVKQTPKKPTWIGVKLSYKQCTLSCQRLTLVVQKKKRKKRPNFFAPLDERPASFLHLR